MRVDEINDGYIMTTVIQTRLLAPSRERKVVSNVRCRYVRSEGIKARTWNGSADTTGEANDLSGSIPDAGQSMKRFIYTYAII
jgi:hypothetical protein